MIENKLKKIKDISLKIKLGPTVVTSVAIYQVSSSRHVQLSYLLRLIRYTFKYDNNNIVRRDTCKPFVIIYQSTGPTVRHPR